MCDLAGWNYRAVRRRSNGAVHIAIYEAYYDRDGNVRALTADPITPRVYVEDEETVAHLQEVIDAMRLAFTRPVLDYETLKVVE